MTCNSLAANSRQGAARLDDEERRRRARMMRVLEEARNGDVWRDAIAGYYTRGGEQSYLIQECVNNGWLRPRQRGHSVEQLELTFRGAKVLGENPPAVAQ